MNILYHHRTRGQEVEAVHIRGIVGGLRALGHRVDIVAPPGVDTELSPARPSGASQPGPPRKASRWAFLTKKAPETLFEAAEIAYNAYAFAALERQLARVPTDLVYERYALFSGMGVMLARRRGVPLILEVNDSAIVPRIRPLKMLAAASVSERLIWSKADAIVTITPYFRDLIIEQGVDPARIHVIPNAVDADDYRALPDRAAAHAALGLSGKLVIGYVGAINHWRRLDLLVDAFERLRARHPRAHLLIIGEGPDRAAIAERIARAGWSDRATFTGRLQHADVPRHLAALDIAVLPHSNLYGSPMKLFEYMASGLPVVAPWLPPIVSILGAGTGGVLFPELDALGLERALDGLAIDDARREALGAEARRVVLERYTWQRHSESIVRLYGTLVRGR